MSSSKYVKIVYENIDDNYSSVNYCYFDLIINNKNGYINATKLCSTFNKKFSEWLKNEENKELIQEVQSMNIDPVVVKNNTYGELRGSYLHPDLIKHVSVWINIETSYAVLDILNDFLKKQKQKELQELNILIDEKQNKINVLKELILSIISKKRDYFVNEFENEEKTPYNFDVGSVVKSLLFTTILLSIYFGYISSVFVDKEEFLYIEF
jgi:hypothetical protein